MSVVVQHRRDSRATIDTLTPADGEFGWDQTLKTIRGGDGSTQGGHLMKKWGAAYTVTPAQITGDQNNYNPTDLAIAEVLVLSADAARTITGLAGGATNRRLLLVNGAGFTLTLANQSASSTAGNRFLFGFDWQLRAGYAVELIYLAASSRWFAIGDALSWRSISNIPENFTLSGDLTPAQITSNQNDYNPTGLSTATVLRLNTDASRNITGIAGGADGRVLTLLNVNTNAIVLKNADSNSTAANRFDMGADITLSAKQALSLWYDLTDSRWKMFNNTAGAAVADGAVTAVKLAGSALGIRAGMVNGTIVESHAGNAAIFAVKTLAGTDPSAIDPVYFVFQTGTGAYVVRTVTAALSVTASSGSSAGASSGVAFRLWLVALDNAGTVELAFVNCVSSGNVLSLNDYVPLTTTAEGGAGGADSAQVIYSATARSSKYTCLLGFYDYDSGLASAGTWASSPGTIVLFGPGVHRPGEEVSLKQASTTAPVQTTSTIATGTGTSISVALSRPQNLFKISALSVGGNLTTNVTARYRLRRGGTDIGYQQSVLASGSVAVAVPMALTATDAPGTVSSQTYEVYYWTDATGTALWQVNSALAGGGASIEASEIMG